MDITILSDRDLVGIRMDSSVITPYRDYKLQRGYGIAQNFGDHEYTLILEKGDKRVKVEAMSQRMDFIPTGVKQIEKFKGNPNIPRHLENGFFSDLMEAYRNKLISPETLEKFLHMLDTSWDLTKPNFYGALPAFCCAVATGSSGTIAYLTAKFFEYEIDPEVAAGATAVASGTVGFLVNMVFSAQAKDAMRTNLSDQTRELKSFMTDLEAKLRAL